MKRQKNPTYKESLIDAWKHMHNRTNRGFVSRQALRKYLGDHYDNTRVNRALGALVESGVMEKNGNSFRLHKDHRKEARKPCPPGKVRNPKTNRCVKRGGAIAKKMSPKVRPSPKKGSVADLKRQAKARGLKGYSKMKKAELQNLLK